MILVLAILTFLMLGCSEADKTQTTTALSEAEVENIVRHFYQYEPC